MLMFEKSSGYKRRRGKKIENDNHGDDDASSTFGVNARSMSFANILFCVKLISFFCTLGGAASSFERDTQVEFTPPYHTTTTGNNDNRRKKVKYTFLQEDANTG